MGISLKAKFPKYANMEHLHPRERIRTFIINENAESQLGTTEWLDAAEAVFEFARQADPRGELEMYAAAVFTRAGFRPIGTTRIDQMPGDEPWKLQLTIFEPDVRSSRDGLNHYLGGSLIDCFPGFPKQWDIPPPNQSRLSGSQFELRYKRFINKITGQISYIPLYDDGRPILGQEMYEGLNGWESKLT